MTSHPAASVYGRRARISPASLRTVLGRDLDAGDVLATGVILQTDHDDDARDVRLEMPGSDVHYVDYDEPVTVLATLDRAALDAISVGVHVARADLRLIPAPPAPPGPEVAEPEPAPPQSPVDPARPVSLPATVDAPGEKSNTGPLGQYQPTVEHYTDTCPIHGEATFARHKAGRTRSGEQRYNRRCLACHTDYNLAHRQP